MGGGVGRGMGMGRLGRLDNFEDSDVSAARRSAQDDPGREVRRTDGVTIATTLPAPRSAVEGLCMTFPTPAEPFLS